MDLRRSSARWRPVTNLLAGNALSAYGKFALWPGRQAGMQGVDDFRFTRCQREQAVTPPGADRAAQFLEGKGCFHCAPPWESMSRNEPAVPGVHLRAYGMPNHLIDLKMRRFKVLRKPLKVFHKPTRPKRRKAPKYRLISAATARAPRMVRACTAEDGA